MSKLTDMSLTRFGEVLASSAPVPGGGGTAALEGALGVALVNMVAALTIGKKKYAEHEELARSIAEEAEALRLRFMEAVDEDAVAFNSMGAVFSMPRDTEEQKAHRAEAMQAALKTCTQPPFAMLELALTALKMAERALGKTNQGAVSDLGVAALSLKAAAQSAWLNILINVGSIKDQAFAAGYRSKGQALLEKICPLADRIYATVLAAL